MEESIEDFEPEAVETLAPNLILYTQAGSYVVIPNVQKFIKDNGGEGLLVDSEDYVHILRKGLKKNTMAWVLLTDEYDA